MFEKIKNILNNNEKRKENLISFLVILIFTLIIVNKILDSNKTNGNVENKDYYNEIGVELAENNINKNEINNELEIKLENILEKISGVGEVCVLLTYSESSKNIPIYNINSSTTAVEEKDNNGGTRITETENIEKDVVTDSKSDVVTEKIIMPTIEGVIVTAGGANNALVKSNIIAAVEAVTGVATHKIQVFEMEE